MMLPANLRSPTMPASEAQAVNRTEFRELADLYFARFGTLLDERIAVSEAKLENRIGAVQLDVARLEGRMDAAVAGLRAEVAAQLRDQMKWMFIFWAGTIVPLAGLIVALGKSWL